MKRNYYSQKGGLRTPFGSTGKKPAPEKEPKLPTCYDEIRQGIATAAARDESDTDLPPDWRFFAALTHEQYSV